MHCAVPRVAETHDKAYLRLIATRWISMLDRLWRRLIWPAVMRDADRLIDAHGRGAYGMARLGATASHEIDGHGHWCSVAREIARRLERQYRATPG